MSAICIKCEHVIIEGNGNVWHDYRCRKYKIVNYSWVIDKCSVKYSYCTDHNVNELCSKFEKRKNKLI